MKNMIRALMLFTLGLCACGTSAQAMFTINVPVDVKEIPATFTMIRVNCSLQGTNAISGKQEAIVTGDYPYQTVTVPITGGKLQTTVTIVFDKKLLPAKYQANPAGVLGADCNFALIDPNSSGGGFTPGFGGLAANKPGTQLVNKASVKF